MLLKAILTTALLGSSAVAMAQTYEPSPYRHDDTYGRVEARNWPGRRQAVIATRVTLAADRQASFLRVDPRFRVSRVRIELKSGGRSYVESVFVRHADGRQEVVPVKQMISARTPRLVVDLPGHDISAIAINTSQIRQARGGGYRHMRPATVRVVAVRR